MFVYRIASESLALPRSLSCRTRFPRRKDVPVSVKSTWSLLRSLNTIAEVRFRVAGDQPGSRSVAVGRNDLATGDGPQRLPGCEVDRILDELDVSVGQEGVEPSGMHASCRNIERQPAPEGVGTVAVRQAAPAIGEWIIGPTPVVVHAVSRRPEMPPHSAGVLKLRGRRR